MENIIVGQDGNIYEIHWMAEDFGVIRTSSKKLMAGFSLNHDGSMVHMMGDGGGEVRRPTIRKAFRALFEGPDAP